MCSFEEDFKQAIENLQEDRKSQGKRPYDVHYCRLPNDPQVCVMARIRGGSSGHSVEVTLMGKDYKVIVPETSFEKSFAKSELNLVIDCIKDLLETSLANQ